jgi:hypothetical protein
VFEVSFLMLLFGITATVYDHGGGARRGETGDKRVTKKDHEK